MTEAAARKPHTLRIETGDLSADFVDGDLVDVRWAGVEVIQRIYVAVRDEAWNTIPARISGVQVSHDGGEVVVDYDAEHEHAGISFAWHGRVRASSAGTISSEMRGVAGSDFAYCKIGFNVHHGLSTHAGRRFRCRTLDGLWEGVFGADLEPQLVREGTLTAMTPHFDRLEVDLDGVEVALDFEGDRFEMQDHRNWADANWKSYGTPLEFGFPMTALKGDEIFQRVTTSVSGRGVSRPLTAEAEIVLDDAVSPGTLPSIGHLLTGMPTDAELVRLSALAPAHLRVDVHPGDDVGLVMAQAARVADELDATLELGLFLRPDLVAEDMGPVTEALTGAGARLERVLVLAETSGFSAFRGACPPDVGAAVRRALGHAGITMPRIVSGTSQFFVDINRDRPDYSQLDGLVFAMNPQVHACDDRSLMQNVHAIPHIVDFARRLYPGVDVVLSPVDLVGREGPFPAGPTADGGPPANIDPRQASDFCAAWTVAALAQMAACGATSATFFELVGPRGLIDADLTYPVFDVAALLGELGVRPLVGVRVERTEDVAVLAFGGGAGVDLVVASTSAAPSRVRLPDGSECDLGPYQVLHREVPAS